jgi:hypothetical protein
VVDYVRQKLLAALAWLKNGTVQDRVQFAKDRGSVEFIEDATLAIDFFVPNLIRGQIHGTHHLRFESAAIEEAATTDHFTLPFVNDLPIVTPLPKVNQSPGRSRFKTGLCSYLADSE